MSNCPKTQKPSFFSRAVAGLVLVALAAACNSPTAPSRTTTPPGENQPETRRNWPDVSGTYTLTLSASGRCASELPEAVRTRTYSATISQVDASLTVTLHGLVTARYAPYFTGELGETNGVRFQLWMEEWLEPWRTILFVSGTITGTIVEEGLSGFLEGEISSEAGPLVFRCTAPDHSVKFSR